MIIIPEENFVGEGANQKCYIHPKDNNLCIKIPKKNIKANLLSHEINYLKKLTKRKKKQNLSFFTNIYKEINTNYGKGYVYDLVRDEKNNKISLTMADYLMDKNSIFSDETLNKAFEELLFKMIKYKVIVKDLCADNICCKILKDDTIEFVLIDGFGHRDKIPLVDWSSYLSKKKIYRRLERNKFRSLTEQREKLMLRDKYKN